MSTDDKNKKDLSDQDVEDIFKQHSEELNVTIDHQAQAEKIVKKAVSETSAKTIAKYTFVSFWTGVLEFASLLGLFMKQQRSEEEKEDSNQKDPGGQ